MKYLIGNWKCHKGLADAETWLQSFLAKYEAVPDCEVVLAVHFMLLPRLASLLHDSGVRGVSLAAQDVSPFPRGNYTGAIAADMLKPVARYVIVGHSERRRYFHETPQDVVNKFLEAADAGLSPIICLENAERCLLTDTVKNTECKGAILAYTPVDSVNFQISESAERVEAQIQQIAELVPGMPVVYGGGVNVENIRKYMALPGLSGVFVGSASLEVRRFSELLQALRS